MGSLSGFGEEYEQVLSQAKAIKAVIDAGLATTQDAAKNLLPRMGWERDLVVKQIGFGQAVLKLQNVCGVYVLASTYGDRDSWAETFGQAFHYPLEVPDAQP